MYLFFVLFFILLRFSIYSRAFIFSVLLQNVTSESLLFYLFYVIFLQVDSHASSFIRFKSTLLRCGQNSNSGCNQNGRVGQQRGQQQQQQDGDGRPEFDGEQMCAEPCNVKGCELIHNSCGSHALVTTSQQAEFRPVWASGEHEATGGRSRSWPTLPDSIMQAEMTLPGVNMINISRT